MLVLVSRGWLFGADEIDSVDAVVAIFKIAADVAHIRERGDQLSGERPGFAAVR